MNKEIEKQLSILQNLSSASEINDFIVHLTQYSDLYRLGEIFANVKIQSLDNNSIYKNLLQLFAEGAVQQYKLNPQLYPTLNPTQLRKLLKIAYINLFTSKVLSKIKVVRFSELRALHDLDDLEIIKIMLEIVQEKLAEVVIDESKQEIKIFRILVCLTNQ